MLGARGLTGPKASPTLQRPRATLGSLSPGRPCRLLACLAVAAPCARGARVAWALAAGH